jgi:stage II sporulation protein D
VARRVLAAVSLAALGFAGAAAASLPETGSTPTAVSCETISGKTTCVTAPVTITGPAASGSTGATTTAASTQPSTSLTPPTVTVSDDATTIVITGHGWGHGMGLAQWGAYGYALHGWSYRRILAHYYTGTTLGTAPDVPVRVQLSEGEHRVTIGSAAPWRLADAHGTSVSMPAGKAVIPASMKVAGKLLEAPLAVTPGTRPLEVGGHAYRGTLLLHSNGKKLQVVNVVGLEDYLDGVVGAEMPKQWPQAALEAQAVAARSFMLAQLPTVPASSEFDVYSDGRSQVYAGIPAEAPSVTKAVAATKGQVVIYGGKVAMTYFSSSSGGRTVSAAEGTGTAIPYLVSVPDPYDTLSPYHDWGPLLESATAVGDALGLGGPVTALDVVPGHSGHIDSVVATGDESQTTLTGAQVQADLGLRSRWFAFGFLGLSPPAAPAAVGASVKLTGTVRGLSGVTLQARPSGSSWQVAGAVHPAADGSFSVTVEPRVTTQYRLASGKARGGLVSVTVAPAVTASLERGRVTGTVAPTAQAGLTVTLEQQSGSRWVAVTTATTGSGGSFAIVRKLARGTYRVVCAPGGGLSPGASAPLIVT